MSLKNTLRVGFALLFVAFSATDALAEDVWLRVDRIHVGDGRVIEKGVVHIRDGKIMAVGASLEVPDGASVTELKGHEITPGLIDANAKVEPGDLLPPLRKDPRAVLREFFGLPAEEPECFHEYQVCPNYTSHEPDQDCPICGGEWGDPDTHDAEVSGLSIPPQALSEQSSEVVPHTAVLDVIDLESPDFERLLRGGVTTVYASPDPSAVIGARGAIIRTSGESGAEIVRREAAVKAVIGSDPYAFGVFNSTPSQRRGITQLSRRPQSRMGVGWIFRKAFHDARLREQGGTPFGADTASPEASRVLAQVLSGQIPMRVQARTASDIESAFRLCGEFNVPFTLVDPVEAYRLIPLLSAAKVPVVFGPIFDQPSRNNLSGRSRGETNRSRLHTVRDLVDAGVPMALSAQDLREEDGLARQAMLAMRSGVASEKALQLVTLEPARILGIEKEVGSVEAGKRADLVVWNGTPFAATSRVVRVYSAGRLAHGEQ